MNLKKLLWTSILSRSRLSRSQREPSPSIKLASSPAMARFLVRAVSTQCHGERIILSLSQWSHQAVWYRRQRLFVLSYLRKSKHSDPDRRSACWPCSSTHPKRSAECAESVLVEFGLSAGFFDAKSWTARGVPKAHGFDTAYEGKPTRS